VPPLVALLAACALGACSSARDGAATQTPMPLPITTGDYPMLGHAADFSWIAGRIERDLSCTYLQFGSARTEPWAGRIVLAGSPDRIAALQTGDTVVIKGALVRLLGNPCGPFAFEISVVEEH
jgi:hypothetical protein